MTVTSPPITFNRSSEFFHSLWWLSVREIRNTLRTPEAFIPSLFIPLFFFFVQNASLATIAQGSGAVIDYKAFVLPVAILFATSNEVAGFNMVTDIERGYFDKLMLTPVSRLSVVLGAMAGNFIGVIFKAFVVSVVAMVTGVAFATGFVGMLAMVLIAGLWGVVFAGVGMAVALKTGSSKATQGSVAFLFPLLFLTTSFAPKESLAGWLKVAVSYNPVTYILEAMRSFSAYGFQTGTVFKGVLAIAVMGAITMSFAVAALRGRMK